MADSDFAMERRWGRLSEELADEGMPLPLAGEVGQRLLGEMHYARRAPFHENRAPRFGALVFGGVPDWDRSPQVPLLVPTGDASVELLRRFADGRSSFVTVTTTGHEGLASFEHSFGEELAAVRLQRSGAIVVQRVDGGVVRVCASHGVVIWNGSRWLAKPLAADYVKVIERLAPHADSAVLTGLLEFAVHCLAAARVGATLVWNVDGNAPDDDRGGLAEIGGAHMGPPLSVVRRGHFPALQSALSQVDLATVVAADGRIGPFGVRLDHTPRAANLVARTGGARHTSARRFSFDVTSVLAVVVSESGAVRVFSGGASVAEIAPGQQEEQRSIDMAKGRPVSPGRLMPCQRCGKRILIDLQDDHGSTGSLSCPVCSATLPHAPNSARVVGVPVCLVGGDDYGRTPRTTGPTRPS